MEVGSAGEVFETKALQVYIPGNKSGIHKGFLLRKNAKKRNFPLL